MPAKPTGAHLVDRFRLRGRRRDDAPLERTRIMIDVARVATNPAAPTSASTRAEPSEARANPAAEAIAATSKAGCTLSVRRSVSSKSSMNF